MTPAEMAAVKMRGDASYPYDGVVVGKDDSECFFFYRLARTGESSPTRFAPVSARLRIASKDVDTLEMGGLPPGLLVAGDVVRVVLNSSKFRRNSQGSVTKTSASNTTVFKGEVDKVVKVEGRGDDATETVVCAGPWAKMARLVYRKRVCVGNGSGGTTMALTSRVILNQHLGDSTSDTDNGLPQNLNSELREIAAHGASACGYSVTGSGGANFVNVSSQYLPFDECRDITIAEAIKRELRFFPKSVTRFDYAQDTPHLHIERMPGIGESYTRWGSNWNLTNRMTGTRAKAGRRITRTAHPVTGVDLEIETVSASGGWRTITHQTAGVTSAGNVDCLYATLQLAGAEGSTVTQSFKSVTEEIPSDLNSVGWWKAKHPRLKGIASSAIQITNGARSGTSDLDVYTRISAASAGDLQEAGLRCRVEEFTCTCQITVGDDQERNILLSMNFLTTNATGTASEPRTYTWVVSSESQAGETAPSGLAAAILADRSGAVAALDVRETQDASHMMPQIGQWCDIDGERLYLQSFEIDCVTRVADLHFGAPDHLAPEDMAALLSGFRNKRRAATAYSRASGRPADDNKANVKLGGIMPLSSTEFAPGVKTKTVINAAGENEAGKRILLNAYSIPAGKTMEIHSLKVNNVEVAKILSTADVAITTSSVSTETLNVVTGITFGRTQHPDPDKIVATISKKQVAVVGSPTDVDDAKVDVTALEDIDVVTESAYDENDSNTFVNKLTTLVVVGTKAAQPATQDVFTTTAHSAESAQQGQGN